ncbi:MAG: serine hydrolase domain-containing protein [Acidobacteriota bacterium]
MNNRIDRRAFINRGLGSLGAAAMLPTVPALAEATGDVSQTAIYPFTLSDATLKRLPKMMALANVPGAAAAIVHNGRLAWHGEFGVKNASSGEKVTAETAWQMGSLGKPVFAFGVMKLVEDGKLDLDRPLFEYVGGEELVKDDPRSKRVTARHALSHSTGLQNWRFQAGDTFQFAFSPGERWSYSGEGIYYLQRAVEQITGQSLEQFMRSRVFEPLGMNNSSYFWLPQYERDLAAAHNGQGVMTPDYLVQNVPRLNKVAEDQKKPVIEWRNADQERAQGSVEKRFPPFPTFFSLNAAGTLISTTADYGKFVASLLEPPKPSGLTAASVTEALKPQVRINDNIAWGLGWGLQTDYDGRPGFWHWGEGINYRNFVLADRESRSAIIVFTNARNGRKIWERIAADAAGSDQPLFVWL